MKRCHEDRAYRMANIVDAYNIGRIASGDTRSSFLGMLGPGKSSTTPVSGDKTLHGAAESYQIETCT